MEPLECEPCWREHNLGWALRPYSPTYFLLPLSRCSPCGWTIRLAASVALILLAVPYLPNHSRLSGTIRQDKAFFPMLPFGYGVFNHSNSEVMQIGSPSLNHYNQLSIKLSDTIVLNMPNLRHLNRGFHHLLRSESNKKILEKTEVFLNGTRNKKIRT